MITSEAGVNLIKKFEGLELTAYRCSANKLTIGYGHTSAAGLPLVKEGMTITKEAAEKILRADLRMFEDAVDWLVKVSLTPNQHGALMSWVYNLGLPALERSTLLKRINAGQFDKVPAEFMKWTKAAGHELPGLVRRRRAESALWRGIDEVAPVVSRESREIPDTPVPSKPITKSREANTSAIVGSAAVITAVSEGASKLKDGADILPVLTESLGRPTVVVLLVIGMACAAIWYWRKQRLDEEGA